MRTNSLELEPKADLVRADQLPRSRVEHRVGPRGPTPLPATFELPALHLADLHQDAFEEVDQGIVEVCHVRLLAAHALDRAALVLRCFLALETEHLLFG